MKEYELYHGTNSFGAEKLINRNFHRMPLISTELRKSTQNCKLPGSLGYGFYTFIEDPELAKNFSQKYNPDDVKIMEVNTVTIDDEDIFDLDSPNNMRKFRQYTLTARKHIERQIGTHKINNKKQNTFDGILLENFIFQLKTKAKKEVKAVKMATHTFLGEEESSQFMSRVNNGQEFCVRDTSIIKSINYYEEEM